MKIKLLYIIVICLLLIQACKRNEDPCNGYMTGTIVNTYNVTDGNKAKIPYSGTDTLVFVSNTGDTATLIGQGKDDYYEKVTKLAKGGDCPLYEVNNYENIDLFYLGNNSINTIKYSVFLSENVVTGLTGFNVGINNKIFSQYNFEYSSNFTLAEDSIVYKNKYSNGKYLNDIKTILYNKNEGILKFLMNNKTWIKI